MSETCLFAVVGIGVIKYRKEVSVIVMVSTLVSEDSLKDKSRSGKSWSLFRSSP